MINYLVKKLDIEQKTIFKISLIVPNFKDLVNLNFRINKIKTIDDNFISDPSINNSLYIFNISKNMLGKRNSFDFVFDKNELLNIKSFCIGFCEENVKWYTDTFKTIDISETISKNTDEIVILSSWNVKCGISQYTKNIYDSLVSKKINVKVFPDKTNYSEVFSFIIKSKPRSFIVQYEPSLIYDFIELKKNILALKSMRIKTKIFFTIHSEYKNLLELDGLIDGFIYHKDNTIQFKKTKVFKIPMGVPVFIPELSKKEYRTIYGISEDRLIISTLGFMFAWKNHANVLSGLLKYMKEDPRILVQYMTSFHSTNNGECVDEFNKINKIVKENNLEDQFIHITDYVTQKELNERLYLSDVGFLWSGIETTSSSASLKEFVASRLPVVKTNSTHYHDIAAGSITTEQDINIFCNIIIQLILDNNRRAFLLEEMEKNYNNLNYNSVINNLLEVLSA
jgi:hypothetical protein